jgi:ABC-type multidrug transport system fused ATPase/permease subunit
MIAGSVTVGTLIAFLQYVERFYRPMRDLAEKYNILQSAMASSERVFQVLDHPIEIPEQSTGNMLSEQAGGVSIEFRNVWFAYRENEWVLRDLSFKIEPGESVAIVGATGAGKTTIISLLLRYYDIQQGQILVNGKDIKDYSFSELRKLLGIVLQDVFIFAGTIADNIRYGCPDASLDEVKQAAKLVHADRFITSLPQKYEEPVMERGSTLSTGQRQLLAFARALICDPQLLILDEATASIDTETEQLIQDAIGQLLSGRTSIIIAHRLSTIQRCDRILVLHHGRLREEGSHSELLALRGIYHRLYRLQFGAPEDVTEQSIIT